MSNIIPLVRLNATPTECEIRTLAIWLAAVDRMTPQGRFEMLALLMEMEHLPRQIFERLFVHAYTRGLPDGVGMGSIEGIDLGTDQGSHDHELSQHSPSSLIVNRPEGDRAGSASQATPGASRPHLHQTGIQHHSKRE